MGCLIVTIEIDDVIARLMQGFPDRHLDEAQFSHTPMFTDVIAVRATLMPSSECASSTMTVAKLSRILREPLPV
ncbi:MAG: hypothetical protein ACRBM6_19675 [Geminicoccales bacterium]